MAGLARSARKHAIKTLSGLTWQQRTAVDDTLCAPHTPPCGRPRTCPVRVRGRLMPGDAKAPAWAGARNPASAGTMRSPFGRTDDPRLRGDGAEAYLTSRASR